MLRIRAHSVFLVYAGKVYERWSQVESASPDHGIYSIPSRCGTHMTPANQISDGLQPEFESFLLVLLFLLGFAQRSCSLFPVTF